MGMEFISSYFEICLQTSIQTAEHLTLASLARSGSPDRSNSKFSEDESIPGAFRSKLQDYFRSGYDRGHMCVE